MALLQVNFFSRTLMTSCAMNVVIPERSLGPAPGSAQQPAWPVLYLLHGASEDHSAWVRHTNIERYAQAAGVAVVMPAGQLSYYSNMAFGGAYLAFVRDELPGLVAEFFQLSDRNEDRYLCGTSMGAYGALRIGLSKPERYAAIGCFSLGAFMHVKPEGLLLDPIITRWLYLAFGTQDARQLKGTEHDPFQLAEQALLAGKRLPRIYHVCGTEDDPAILDAARRTRDFFAAKPCDYTYIEGPGGHSWDYWDASIQNFLKWLTKSE